VLLRHASEGVSWHLLHGLLVGSKHVCLRLRLAERIVRLLHGHLRLTSHKLVGLGLLLVALWLHACHDVV